MEITKNKKIRDFVMNRISQELGNMLVRPYGRELWVIDDNSSEVDWFVVIESNGTAWYNQKKFYDLLRIFSLEENENKFFIKYWIEEYFRVRISSVSRRNTNYQYIIERMIKSIDKEWSLKDRYGFSYQVVKNYIDFKKNTLYKEFRVRDYCSLDLPVIS